MTPCCLADFVATFCLHFQCLLWLCRHTVLLERCHSASSRVVLIQGCFIVARSKKSRTVFFWFCMCLCVVFAYCGIVDDQLHDGKDFFFLLFSWEPKNYCLVRFALCLEIISHFLEYIALKATPESKKEPSSPLPGNLLDSCYSEKCILSTFLYGLDLIMCGTHFF
jgi:hypothetical protein